MKIVLKGKTKKPRKSNAVLFRSGSGWHKKNEKTLRRQAQVRLKKDQEVFQSTLFSVL